MPNDKENDKEKNNEFQFEIVNENEMQFASRGRKSNVSDEQLEMVANQVKKSPNKYIRIVSFAVPKDLSDVKAQKNHKAKVSSTLRLMGKKMGYTTTIRWDMNNIPCVLFSK